MRKFIYFLSADARHLQTRLERLAAKGLEITSTTGFFTGIFEETKRSDLRYLVVPFGNQRHFPDHVESRAYGWELIGAYNGMAIYKTLPCVEADEAALRIRLAEEEVIHQDHYTLPLLFAFLFLLGALAWLTHILVPEANPWYLSYAGMILPAFSGVCFFLLAVNLLSLRTYLSAWIHGLTTPALVLSASVGLTIWQLDHRQQSAAFIIFLVLLALAWLLTFWRFNRGVSWVIPGVCLLVLCVGMLFPHTDATSFSGSGLRRHLEGAPVVDLTHFGVEESLNASGYQTEGTFLVRKTTYWEISNSGTSCTCEVYSCGTTALADALSEQLCGVGTWESVSEGLLREDGREALLRRRNVLVLVSFSQPMDDATLFALYSELFG